MNTRWLGYSDPHSLIQRKHGSSCLICKINFHLASHPIWMQLELSQSLVYSGDLNNGNIWITNFHLSGIQMVVRYSDHHLNTGPVFKWWSEYQTKFSKLQFYSKLATFCRVFKIFSGKIYQVTFCHFLISWEQIWGLKRLRQDVQKIWTNLTF